MNVTFCGHAQVVQTKQVEEWLYTTTQGLIEQGATNCYLGDYGAFDNLAASVLRAQKKRYPQVELILVLAYLETAKDISGYDGTVYPPLESVPRRFAISHRNRWMVDAADVVVPMSCMTGAVRLPRFGMQNAGEKRSSLLARERKNKGASCVGDALACAGEFCTGSNQICQTLSVAWDGEGGVLAKCCLCAL